MIRLIIQRMSRCDLLVDNECKYDSCGAGCIIYVSFIRDETKKKAGEGGGGGGDAHEDVDKLKAGVDVVVQRLLSSNALAPGPQPPTATTTTDENASSSTTTTDIDHCNLVLIPQAAAGGKLKGKSVQFHSNLAKNTARQLYAHFHQSLDEQRKSSKSLFASGRLVAGMYDGRQALRFESNGPNTHMLEFSLLK